MRCSQRGILNVSFALSVSFPLEEPSFMWRRVNHTVRRVSITDIRYLKCTKHLKTLLNDNTNLV